MNNLRQAAEKLLALMDGVPDDLPGGQSDRVFAHFEFDELREALGDPEKPDVHRYYSARGIPLVYWGPVDEVPVLTVENYLKWYTLQLIHINGEIEEIGEELDEPLWAQGDTAWHDHVPNPKVVERFAELNGYHLDTEALDMIAGRYWLEVLQQK